MQSQTLISQHTSFQISFKIKNSYTFTEADGVDTLENIGNKLKAYYPNGISSDEILQVTYSSVENGDTAYWYYYTNNTWGRAQLTGGVSSLIEQSYKENVDNKTYSINYINSLIGGDGDTSKTAYSKD